MLAAAFALGLIVGSFANVCIYRLPAGESVAWPPSHCPRCGAPIRWYDNIPLLSFAVLRGRCRHCGGPISWRYPLVEALTGALFVQSVAAFGGGLRTALSMVLGTLLLIVFFVDLDHHIIPNRITYPGTIAGLLFWVPFGWKSVAVAAATAVALGGAFILVNAVATRIIGEEAMGMGDAKLAAMIGAFLGWPFGGVAVLLGIFLGGVVGLVLLALRLKGRREHVPFGPALAGGAVAALWWGPIILRWYVSRMLGA